MDKELIHAGTRHSGRYPHGWGENPHQHCMDFRAYVYKLRGQGVDDKIIAKSMNMNTTQLRTQLGLAAITWILILSALARSPEQRPTC